MTRGSCDSFSVVLLAVQHSVQVLPTLWSPRWCTMVSAVQVGTRRRYAAQGGTGCCSASVFSTWCWSSHTWRVSGCVYSNSAAACCYFTAQRVGVTSSCVSWTHGRTANPAVFQTRLCRCCARTKTNKERQKLDEW
jgi:hypothetical protein